MTDILGDSWRISMYDLGLCLLSDPEVSLIFMEIFPKETVAKNIHYLKEDNFLAITWQFR